MAGMKRPYYTVVPGLLVLAFTLYNLTAILKTGNRQKEVVYEMSKALSSTGLSTSEIKGYEKDVQQLRQQNRVMHESLDLLQNKLISLLLTAKRAPEPSQGTTEPQEQAAPTPSTAVESGGPSSSRPGWSASKPYTFWSSDFHISPIADLKDLFEPMGMKIIDKSLSGHCHLKNTCAKDLKVLNKGNGIDLGHCPNQLRRDFFEAYKDDPQMKAVDAFLCHHACGLCEVFMPFNKSLIVIASTRYEIGRHSPSRWALWNENLKKIAANPRNVVAANNLYDAEYIKYFTGLRDVPVLPNYCGYTGVTYSPQRPEILVGPGRGIHEGLFRELKSAGERSGGLVFARVRDLYPHFEYSDLVQHKAVVLIPYQVSVMSIFEYYRMGIPMFAPSPALLARWQVQHRLMNERTWDGVFGHPEARSAIGPAPGVSVPHDPNNEKEEAAIRHWIAFSDFYQWPHIPTFDSWDDLIAKLKATDLQAQSGLIQAHNEQMKEGLKQQWRDIFARIFDGLPPAAESPREQVMDFDESMKAMYSVKVHGACEGDTHL